MKNQGAKGSVKNRIYQFWLIQLFLKRRKKKIEQKLLKEKQKRDKIEKRKREVLALFSEEQTPKYVLSKNPEVFRKKEGIVITIYPLGRKPDRIVEVYEIKRNVGIDSNNTKLKETKKIEFLDKKASDIIVETKKNIESKAKKEDEYKEKSEQLKQNLEEIEQIKRQYGNIVSLSPLAQMSKSVLGKTDKKARSTFQDLVEVEKICKNELNRIKMHLHKENDLVIDKKIDSTLESITTLDAGKTAVAIAGGTIIAFPALIQKLLSPDKKMLKESKKKEENPQENKQSEKEGNNKKEGVSKKNRQSEKEETTPKWKLYKIKLEASKEAEILIKSELKRQKDYLKRINEKMNTLDVKLKTTYHFEGIHKLIENVLKFALGVLTIPFSKKKLFGTVVGVTLINNSIRGIKNSFRKKENQISYIEFKNFSKVIFNEKMMLLKMKNLIVDSLGQIKDLKSELEYQFYGKVSYSDYDEMKQKLIAMEKQLLEKQKEIQSVQESLENVEEKSKVKLKKLQGYYEKH